MSLRIFTHQGQTFIVQSFKAGDFANICIPNGDSFHVDFTNRKVHTCNKESKSWREKAAAINIAILEADIKSVLELK